MAMKTKATTTPCHSCGAPLASTARFCPECGSPVRRSGARTSFGPRYAAFLVDLTVVLGLYVVASTLIRPFLRLFPIPENAQLQLGPFLPNVSALAGVLLFPVVAFVYFAIATARGSSVGKRQVAVSVRATDGGRPGIGRGFVRSGVLWLPVIVLLFGSVGGILGLNQSFGRLLAGLGSVSTLVIWLFGLVTSLSRRGRRGLHDLAAGTEVVRA